MKVILKSKRNTHYAEAIYTDGKITVLKGSKICKYVPPYMERKAMPIYALRNNQDIVNEEGVVLQNVEFNSPTSAAIFVTGRSVNGYISWRPEDKVSLKEYLKR